jgi:hypothetical protein
MTPMSIVRRFLVFQSLALWQGGFIFYAAIVVPVGTDVLGTFEQGRVTRHVTNSMNIVGVVTLAILAWDQWACSCRWARWGLWIVMAGTLAALAWLRVRVESSVDFSSVGGFSDYGAFYFWHRVYLCVSAVQWVAGLAYVGLLVRQWSATRPSC